MDAQRPAAAEVEMNVLPGSSVGGSAEGLEALMNSYDQTAAGIAGTSKTLEQQLSAVQSTAAVVKKQLAEASSAGKVTAKKSAEIDSELNPRSALRQSPASHRHSPY